MRRPISKIRFWRFSGGPGPGVPPRTRNRKYDSLYRTIAADVNILLGIIIIATMRTPLIDATALASNETHPVGFRDRSLFAFVASSSPALTIPSRQT